MREALFAEPLPGGKVLCRLCPHECRVAPGRLGACGVRFNSGGTLQTLVDRRIVSGGLDPVEKKPLFHFHPGSGAWSIATVGCNLRCLYCQNWEISQGPKGPLGPRPVREDEPDVLCPELAAAEGRIPGEEVEPESIVRAAVRSGAVCIAYTYTEPTIFYELALETATLAREAGLKNVFVTNGYTCEEPIRRIAPLLDAVNVDLKFAHDDRYRRVSGARLQPVLDAIRLYHGLGVWVEVTTLLIPGWNDSDDDVRALAGFVSGVSPDVPWHLSRYFPAWCMRDVPPTPAATLRRARRLASEAGVRYVYVGNLPDPEGESTDCPDCGRRVITRSGSGRPRVDLAAGSRCPACGARIAGVGLVPEGG